MAVMLTDLADVLRKAGLDVVEIPGWKTRGRPGEFNPKGVLCHHTAGPNDGYDDAYYMAVIGRTDLSAPLAQLALSRKGVFYVLAAGRANHAGRCKAIGGLKPYPGESYGDGNAQLVGIEAQNRGTDAEDWSPAQYGAYVRGVAALCEHYGWSIVFGHKETSTSGKVDPDFPMDKFRRDVAATSTQEDDDMSAEDVTNINKYTANLLLYGYTEGGEPKPSILAVLTETQRRVTRTEAAIKAMAEGLDDEVKEGVLAALAAEYDAKVELTRKTVTTEGAA